MDVEYHQSISNGIRNVKQENKSRIYAQQPELMGMLVIPPVFINTPNPTYRYNVNAQKAINRETLQRKLRMRINRKDSIQIGNNIIPVTKDVRVLKNSKKFKVNKPMKSPINTLQISSLGLRDSNLVTNAILGLNQLSSFLSPVENQHFSILSPLFASTLPFFNQVTMQDTTNLKTDITSQSVTGNFFHDDFPDSIQN